MQRNVFGARAGAAHVMSADIPLARIWSQGCSHLCRGLGNGVELCAQEEKERAFFILARDCLGSGKVPRVGFRLIGNGGIHGRVIPNGKREG